MKAITFARYGTPDVLELRDVPNPTPAARELLTFLGSTRALATLEAVGPLHIERVQDAWMDLTEMGHLVLRAELAGARTAGMEPVRRPGHNLQALHGCTGGLQRGDGVGLGVEGIDRA